MSVLTFEPLSISQRTLCLRASDHTPDHMSDHTSFKGSVIFPSQDATVYRYKLTTSENTEFLD